MTAAVWAGPMEGKEATNPWAITHLFAPRGPLGDKSDIRACLVSPDLHEEGGVFPFGREEGGA